MHSNELAEDFISNQSSRSFNSVSHLVNQCLGSGRPAGNVVGSSYLRVKSFEDIATYLFVLLGLSSNVKVSS